MARASAHGADERRAACRRPLGDVVGGHGALRLPLLRPAGVHAMTSGQPLADAKEEDLRQCLRIFVTSRQAPFETGSSAERFFFCFELAL